MLPVTHAGSLSLNLLNCGPEVNAYVVNWLFDVTLICNL
jgi:hypothetical protein